MAPIWTHRRCQGPDCRTFVGVVSKGGEHYPEPVALVARLGDDVAHEGRGLGTGLLGDIVARLAEHSDEIGCRGLLVHCESTAPAASVCTWFQSASRARLTSCTSSC